METIRVIAPAKVNLFLGVGKKRDDGFHEALSIMQTLVLHDTVTMAAVSADDPRASCMKSDSGAVPMVAEEGLEVGVDIIWHEGMDGEPIPAEENLAVRAVFALGRALGFPWKGAVRMTIDKHIPAQAGLAGGSTDAAAALVGAATLWGIDATDAVVEETARSLGTDVAFFLQGGCAAFDGRGEVFLHALTPRKDAIVLVFPDGGVSTAAAYGKFDDGGAEVPADLRESAYSAVDAKAVPLYNNLAAASEEIMPELVAIRTWIAEQPGVQAALLSGSGSATIALCQDDQAASHLAVKARRKGYQVRVTSCTAIKAAVLPHR